MQAPIKADFQIGEKLVGLNVVTPTKRIVTDFFDFTSQLTHLARDEL